MQKNFFQQLMFPQLAMGGIETAFNGLIQRSQVQANLRKLSGKVLKISLTEPNLSFFIVFSDKRTDWLSHYEGQEDCAVSLKASVLPQLANKQQLAELINNQSLVLNGDIQILQHFSSLLDELEKDPAEWLSYWVGDVVAQASTTVVKKALAKLKRQVMQDSEDLIDNLTIERPVLVHRLQLVDFGDQVQALAQQAVELEQKFAKLGL